jgi:hypothetical protein
MQINCPCGHTAAAGDFNITTDRSYLTVFCPACYAKAAWHSGASTERVFEKIAVAPEDIPDYINTAWREQERLVSLGLRSARVCKQQQRRIASEDHMPFL